MEKLMKCTFCGHDFKKDQTYCTSCGWQVEERNLSAGMPDAKGQASPPAPIINETAAPSTHQSRWWVIAFGVLVSLSCIGAIIGVPLIMAEVNAARGKRKPIPAAHILIGCAVLIMIGMIADKTEKPKSSVTSTNPVTQSTPSKEDMRKEHPTQTRPHTSSGKTPQPAPSQPFMFKKSEASSQNMEAANRADLSVSVSDVVAEFAERGFPIINHPGTQRSDGWVGSTDDGSLSVSLQGNEPNGTPDELTSAIFTMNIRTPDDERLPYPKKQYLALFYQMVLPGISIDRLPDWSNEIATELDQTHHPVVRVMNEKNLTATITADTILQVKITRNQD